MNPELDSHQAMSMIVDVLYPLGDKEHEWEVADLEKIAAIADHWLLFA